MGKVATGFSMSLDGFIAGPNDEVERLFAWMSQGNTDFKITTGDTDYDLNLSSDSASLFEQAIQNTGAIVTGRRLFDITSGWGGKHPLNAPIFVVTHTIPQTGISPDSPFTFVTDGVESAIRQARQVAGDKNVVVVSSTIVQQCLQLGLLDEIHIDLVSVLLGQGIRLFDHLGANSVELERTSLVGAPGVTQITYSVLK